MEQEENQEPNSAPLPILPRLDRLDRLLQLLEEKHRASGRHSSTPVITKTEQDDDQCKALSSALEEVHHKGTLMERLSTLENRVLQLSLDMDEGNTSRSSSSTALVSEFSGHDSVVPKVSRQDEGEMATHLVKQEPLLIQEEEGCGEACKLIRPTSRGGGKREKGKANRKWRTWFQMGC